MKLILGTLPSVYSLYFLNVFLRENKGQIDTVVVSTRPVLIHKRPIQGLGDVTFLIQQFGWAYFSFLLANQWLISQVNKQSKTRSSTLKLWSLDRLSKEFDFNLFYSNDFNDRDTITYINSRNVDYFLINGCDQILSSQFLYQTQAEAINIHPSRLPDDRGVDPVFQKLLRKEYDYSTSLHQITADIDRGPIYLQQQHNNSIRNNYLESSMAHAILAARVLSQFSGIKSAPKPQAKDGQFPYKSWPLKREVAQFKAQQGKFISKRSARQFLNFSFQVD